MIRPLLARVTKAVAARSVAIACVAVCLPAAQAQMRPFVPGMQIVPGQKVYYPQQPTATAPMPSADPSWVIPASHGYGNCPCPDPHGEYTIPLGQPAPFDVGDGAVGSGAADIGEDLPEVADVSGDVTYASAPQSAVPNSIGDSFDGCGQLQFFNGVDPPAHVDVCPAGGRQFKVAHNNSAVPRTRVFGSYNHFDEAVGGSF